MSFLSRLAQSPRESEIERIARNLYFVLSTRKGVGSVVEDFGLGEYETETNTQACVRRLVAEIEAAVVRYEPRLRAPAVTLLGRGGANHLRFVLAGDVDGIRCRWFVDVDMLYRQFEVSPAGEGATCSRTA